MVCKERREVASNDSLCFLLFDMHHVPEVFDLLAPCASGKDYLTAGSYCFAPRERHSEEHLAASA
jgi:hypothetical protein